MLELFGLEVTPAMAWLAVGFILLLLEVATGTLWLLWPGLAALAFAAIAAFTPEMPLGLQIVLFAGLAALLTYLGHRYFRGRPTGMTSDRPNLNRRSAQLIGRRVSAIGPFANGYGSVRLDDGQWSARLESGMGDELEEGAPLIIKAVEGARLVVAPA